MNISDIKISVENDLSTPTQENNDILIDEKVRIYNEVCQCYSQCLKFENSKYKKASL